MLADGVRINRFGNGQGSVSPEVVTGVSIAFHLPQSSSGGRNEGRRIG